jgi:outer membrane protein OmpA-like peptidoglycan-associated protein
VLMWRRRSAKVRPLAGGTLMVLVVMGSMSPDVRAAGTGFIADGFEALPAHHRNHVIVSTSDILAHGDASTSLIMSQARDILSASDLQVGGVDSLSYPIQGQLRTEVLAAFGLYDLMDIGVAIPVLAYQWGDDLAGIDRVGEEVDGTALGDVRIHPRIRFVRREATGGLGVALAASLHLPTGDSSSFNSMGVFRAEPRLIFDWLSPDGRLAIATNLGYHIGPRYVYRGLVFDDDLRWGASLQSELALGDYVFIATFGARGSVPLEMSLGAGDLDKVGVPVELLGALKFPLSHHVVSEIGYAQSPSTGIGAASFRAFFGLTVGWPKQEFFAGPVPLEGDRDGDLLIDPIDACPDEAEDADGVQDEDGCPELDRSLWHQRQGVLTFAGEASAILSEKSHAVIRDTANAIAEVANKEGGIDHIMVLGFADELEDDASNERLARERAEAVAGLLATYGIAREFMKVEASAGGDPLRGIGAPERSPDARRVQLRVVLRGTPEPTKTTQSTRPSAVAELGGAR